MKQQHSFVLVRILFGLTFLHAVLLTNILSILSCANSAAVKKNETDRLALLAFKDGISDDPNRVLSSWNNSVHFCTWAGVTCSKKHPQRVTVLNLSSNRLVGSLPPHIGNLSFLKSIDLSVNGFQGQIPQEIDHLFRLQQLNLASNLFTGGIPRNMTSCVELREVNLFDNKLEGKLPIELGSLLKLQLLGLGKNNLSGHIPPSLGNLSSLTDLYLSKNKFVGSIPGVLGRLSNLQTLAVGRNDLSGMIPSSLYNLSFITTFDVAYNNLRGSLPQELGLSLPDLDWFFVGENQLTGPLPNSLGNASGISYFALASNHFTGPVPGNLGRLQRLRWLLLGDNQLSGDLSFIQSLTNCTWLETLSIDQNKLSGILPNSIANFSVNLTRFGLTDNQIFGTIPVGIGNLASLLSLAMGGNLFTGTIPIQLGKLQKLEGLDLERNRLSGQIPPFLGNLSRLSLLYLDENDLRGRIPSSLGSCQYLQALQLTNNNLTGSIPTQVLNVPSLIYLELAGNSLSGDLLFNAEGFNSLVRLDLSRNKFSGEIGTFGNCLSLEVLLVEGNKFHGIIPSSLSALKGIRMLDLSKNNLSGKIPKFLEKLSHLHFLNLSFNNLEGAVPVNGIFQNPKAFSIIGNGKLCGGLPMLKLPSCPKEAYKKKGQKFSRNLTISIIVLASLGALLLLSVVTIRYCLKRSCRRSTSTSPLENLFSEVTYAEILEATNRFSSTNLIGEGSYGFVYKGFIDRIGKIVAIKVLKLQQQRASKSFIAECKALRNIRHRNIVKVFTVCSSIDFSGNDFKAFVFEYMPNGNLDTWLYPNENEDNQLRKLNFAQRINIAIDVACTLDYLHHHCPTPIVHCDLKPNNILLDNDMVAHVSDFGLARIFSVNDSQSSSLLVKGSIGYVAPEYGMGSDVSIYGDVYSYGIFLLELFIGKKPTDDMFKDNLSLHQFAKMALPDRVMDIIDHRLLLEETEVLTNDISADLKGKLQECVTALMSMGVSCSSKLPKERMEMKDIVAKLQRVRELYLSIN